MSTACQCAVDSVPFRDPNIFRRGTLESLWSDFRTIRLGLSDFEKNHVCLFQTVSAEGFTPNWTDPLD